MIAKVFDVNADSPTVSMFKRPMVTVILILIVNFTGLCTEVAEDGDTEWKYSERSAEMGRGTDKFAVIESSNTVDFQFPYQSGQHLKLCLRKSPKFGKDVILRMEQGQFTSSYSQNFVTVRFDGHELQKFVAGDSDDGSSNVLFIRHYERFVSQLRHTKTLKIEASFFREGARVFEFDVRGLKHDW